MKMRAFLFISQLGWLTLQTNHKQKLAAAKGVPIEQYQQGGKHLPEISINCYHEKDKTF
jgi:hypothetical protein